MGEFVCKWLEIHFNLCELFFQDIFSTSSSNQNDDVCFPPYPWLQCCLKLLQVSADRLAQLESLLQKSSVYVKCLKEEMDRVRVNHAKRTDQPTAQRNKGKKRARVVSDSEEEREAKRTKAIGSQGHENPVDSANKPSFAQPALLTGATLKDYQLEGVAWMAGLYHNGISGILGAYSVCSCSSSN